MNETMEKKLYRELEKHNLHYGLTGDGDDTTCDVTIRREPLLSYAIYMSADSDEFILQRDHIRKDGYGFDVLVETPIQTFKSVAPLIRRILSDSKCFLDQEKEVSTED